MTTSEPGPTPTSVASVAAPADPSGASLASELERLANQVLAQLPGAATEPRGMVPLGGAPGPSASFLSLGPPAGAAAPSPVSAAPRLTAPPHISPTATELGAGGGSSAQTVPPFPGAPHQPPISSAPPPKESDLRTVPALFSESLGFSSPLVLAGAHPPMDATPSGTTPYFIELAGISGGAPAPTAAAGI